ncbi:hypothetical protein GCM10009839_77540 [Catenulispora yoronensis]|uniref:Uncharacterized protein n=2 Tax=Catenulispora yoronensis TaxID=450799 RepID=A0ABN2VA35_9ACTN
MSTATSAAPAAKQWPAFDPPSDFRSPDTPSLPADAIAERLSVGGVLAAPPAVLLKDRIAFVGGRSSIQAVDPDSGKVLATVSAKYPTATHPNQLTLGPAAAAPVLATVGGREVVLSAVASTVPAQGTTGATGIVELLEMDAATHAAAGDVQIPLGAGAAGSSYRDYGHVTVAAVTGTTAILQVGQSDAVETIAFDLVANKPLWRQDGTTLLHAGAQQLLVATQRDPANNELAALDLATGAKKWEKTRYSQVGGTSIGPDRLLMTAFDSERGKLLTAVITATDGSESQVSTDTVHRFTTCFDDAAPVTVCTDAASSGPAAVSAFDPATGKVLWQLPDTAANRVAPRVTAVRHGRVYGTVDGTPVMLDAATGADVPGTPNIAPLVVDGYFGLALDAEKKNLVAYHTSA